MDMKKHEQNQLDIVRIDQLIAYTLSTYIYIYTFR